MNNSENKNTALMRISVQSKLMLIYKGVQGVGEWWWSFVWIGKLLKRARYN